ncbi:MAG: polysaccharide biosynthesis tyrosine autokinase [Acidobacteriota bacterium]
MELRQYFSLIGRWIWLVVLAAGIAGASSYYWNSQLPRVYMASTSLLVGRSLENPNPNTGDLQTSQQLAQTYIQIARTDPVMQGTIDALGLNMGADQLRNSVSASIVQGTQLIELRVADTNPARAQAIANEYAHQLIAQTPTGRDASEVARLEFVQSQIQDIQSKLEDAQKKTVDLQRSISVTSSAREIADKQQQLLTLQGQTNAWQTTYATLLTALAPRASNYLSVVEPAKFPTFPIAPNAMSSAAVAALIGATLAIAMALLIEYLDDTVKTPADVNQSLELSSLGAIGNIWGDSPRDRLITAAFPRAAHSEAYRIIRTNLQAANLEKPVKTLLVTSPDAGDGKSITAANIAVVMAQSGLRVILADADLRRPSQHTIFNLSNDFGLVNLLRNSEVTLEGCLQPTRVENLSMLTSGPLPPNPAELIDSKGMRLLVRRLEEQFDMVIFDTPPCLPRTDAAILARHLDGVVFVLAANLTRRDSALRAKEVITRAGGKIIGVVLNRIPRSNSYYSYYYSDYGKRSNFGPLKNSAIGRVVRRFTDRAERG